MAANYTDSLHDILEFTGGSRLLTVSDIAKYLGRNRAWVYQHFGDKVKGGMYAVDLARALTSM